MWYGTDAPPLSGHEALSVAPMVDHTDRHFRFLARLLSRRTVLYGEMIWDSAIAKSAADGLDALDELLSFSAEEHPVVAQLGGSTPELMERAAEICVARYGYDAVNLNAGCPAASGPCFGAALMKRPALVGELCAAIGRGARMPATLKCRLGVDEYDSAGHLDAVLDAAMAAGVDHVVVHARKAILGLDTAKNRSVPPLRHDAVRALVDAYPHLRITINGGIKTLRAARHEIDAFGLHGAMIGRQAYAQPWILADADRAMFGAPNRATSRDEVLAAFAVYADGAVEEASPARQAAVWRAALRPISGMFASTPCSKAWRQALLEEQHRERGREALVPPSAVLDVALATLRASAAGRRELGMAPPDSAG